MSLLVIVGCGYTGRRVAQRLSAHGVEVIATSRDGRRLPEAPVVVPVRFELRTDADLSFIPSGALVLYSIPGLDEPDPSADFIRRLRTREPRRVVYLSTTGVY